MKSILKINYICIIFVLTMITITNVYAANDEMVKYEGNKDDCFYDTIIDDENLIAVGSSNSTDINGITNIGSYDAIIVKYDKNDSIVWQKNYGTENSDSFNSVIATSDGYIAVGNKNSSNPISDNDSTGIFVKYDKQGNKVWDKYYKSSEGTKFSEIEKISDEEYIISGEKYEEKTSIPIILKINKTGDVIFEEISLEEYKDYFISKLILTEEKEYILLLYDKTNSVILKLDKNGEKIWNKIYDMNKTQNPVFQDGILTTKGTYLIVGGNEITSTSGGVTNKNLAFILEYDKSGNLLNETILEKYKQGRINAIIEQKDGYVFIGKVSNIENIDVSILSENNFDVKIFKIDKESKTIIDEKDLGIKTSYKFYNDSFAVRKLTDEDYYFVINFIEKGSNNIGILKSKKVVTEDNNKEEKTLWDLFVDEYKKTETVELITSDEEGSFNIISTPNSLKIELNNENESITTNFTYKDGIVTYVPTDLNNEEVMMVDSIWIMNCIEALSNLKGYDVDLLNELFEPNRNFTLENNGLEIRYTSDEMLSSFKLDIKNGLRNVFEDIEDEEIVDKVEVPDTLSNASIVAIIAGILLTTGGIVLYFKLLKDKTKKYN